MSMPFGHLKHEEEFTGSFHGPPHNSTQGFGQTVISQY